LDQTDDGVLLLQSRDSILVSGAEVDRGIKKICAGLQSRISVTEVVFIRAGDVKSNDVTAVSGEKRRNITYPFASPGKSCACHRPLLGPGKASVKRVDGSKCHGLAPCHIVILRMLRAVTRE